MALSTTEMRDGQEGKNGGHISARILADSYSQSTWSRLPDCSGRIRGAGASCLPVHELERSSCSAGLRPMLAAPAPARQLWRAAGGAQETAFAAVQLGCMRVRCMQCRRAAQAAACVGACDGGEGGRRNGRAVHAWIPRHRKLLGEQCSRHVHCSWTEWTTAQP